MHYTFGFYLLTHLYVGILPSLDASAVMITVVQSESDMIPPYNGSLPECLNQDSLHAKKQAYFCDEAKGGVNRKENAIESDEDYSS
jgi:hypothetical protein